MHRFKAPLARYLLVKPLVYPGTAVTVCHFLCLIDSGVYSLLIALLCLTEVIASLSAVHGLGAFPVRWILVCGVYPHLGTTKMGCE